MIQKFAFVVGSCIQDQHKPYIKDIRDVLDSTDTRIIHSITSPPYNRHINYGGDPYNDLWNSPFRWVETVSNCVMRLHPFAAPGSTIWLQLDRMAKNLFLARTGDTLGSLRCDFDIIWQKSGTNPDGKSWGQFRPYTGSSPHSSYEYMLKIIPYGMHDLYNTFNRTAPGLGVEPVDKKNIKRFSSCSGGLRCRGDIWSVPHVPRRSAKHPCPLPPDLVKLALSGSMCAPGHLVFDPFCGVGNTALAALDKGADFLGFDVVENYIEIAIDNLQKRAKIESRQIEIYLTKLK